MLDCMSVEDTYFRAYGAYTEIYLFVLFSQCLLANCMPGNHVSWQCINAPSIRSQSMNIGTRISHRCSDMFRYWQKVVYVVVGWHCAVGHHQCLPHTVFVNNCSQFHTHCPAPLEDTHQPAITNCTISLTRYLLVTYWKRYVATSWWSHPCNL